MKKPSTLLLVMSSLLLAPVHAQTASDTQDFTYTISAAQTWTDTSLDLQAGDLLQISASATASAVPDRHAVAGTGNCDPNGAQGTAQPQAQLPLPSAPVGALIARLHAQGAAPILIGAQNELHIEEASHLFLGANSGGAPACEGSFVVKVHRTQGASASTVQTQAQALTTASNTTKPQSSSTTPTSTASPTGTRDAQPKSRGETLKSQLSSAAQIFMAGQFGTGKTDSTSAGASNATSGGSAADAEAAPVPALKVSQAALDSDLRKGIDDLPRRVNDQFKNLGDMVNFVIVGSEKDVQAALDAANWHVADTTKQSAALSAVLQTYENKDYLQMPMSTLYLFGRAQDFGYEQAEPIAMVASRHHFRIWKAPFAWNGHEVWVGAGTHDIGFAKDKRNGSVTHKIDPAVDGERDNIGSSLQKGGKAKTLSYYLPPSPVQDARNATGDGYHSDGRLLVIFLQ
jgi:hypothetical protein